MSSLFLILSDAEFMTQQCPQACDNYLDQAIDGTMTGIVTYIKVANNHYQALSLYEDDKWIFPASKGTKAQIKSSLQLNFSTITHIQMKRMAKWVIWNKMKNDLAVNTLRKTLSNMKIYFQWVMSSDTTASHGLTAFTSSEYVKHVNMLNTKQKNKIKSLVLSTKVNRLSALEDIYHHCKGFDFVKAHPWTESSSNEQASLVGEATKKARTQPKTPIIPDDVLLPLCQFTKSYLDRADEILASKGKRQSIVLRDLPLYQFTKSYFDRANEISTSKVNRELILLRDSCIFWLLLTTGMRIHEILGIKRGAYRSETRDEVTYYYIETTSDKTHTGLAEWIAPKIAIKAINILAQYSAPLQKQLESDLSKAKANKDHEEMHRLKTISNHICLSVTNNQRNAINLLSGTSITTNRLPNLCKQIGNDWNLSTHQFRRTFANYAVHSELSDLRTLKEHFKHWSITMTALYAFNEDLDAELFEELLREKYLIEEEIKQDWFELDTPITGGAMAQNIKKVREDGELIKTFGSRKAMAKAYSNSIPIRSTGIGWCTNDEECQCGKPDSCDSGIVDKRHLPYWEGMLVQQMTLIQLDDIGDVGKSAVKKGMERCEKVLTALGVDIEKMKQEISQRAY